MQLNPIANATTQTMSSREIAELTGKELSHIHRDIRAMVSALEDDPQMDNITEEKDSRGYTLKFNISKDLANLLLDKYKGLARVPMRLQEEAALKTIEQLLGITLIRQYSVLNYRIDGYDCYNNIAYEVDEPHHNGSRNKTKDCKRQKEIEAVLNCKFVRIKL